MRIAISGARGSMRWWTTHGARPLRESDPVMNDSTPKVLVERIIPAPPRKVFEAWLDPEALRHFMLGAPGMRVTRAECEPRVGGKFLIVMSVGGQDLPHS